MSISYNNKIPADGNPEGIVDAPLGACFYKNGSFYKVNYSGSAAAGWVNAYFKSTTTPNYFLTSADLALLAADTGSYLYTKSTPQGTPYGWTLISRAYMFNPQYLEPTPTPTPTPAPSTPSLQYNESQYGSPGVFTDISCGDTISVGVVDTAWTLTVRIYNNGTTDLSLGPMTVVPTNATLDTITGPDVTITPGNYSDAIMDFTINDSPASVALAVISDGTVSICGATFNVTTVSTGCTYTAPTLIAETGSVFIKGFANLDFMEPWTNGLPYSGPASYGDTMTMTDDGLLIYAAGAASDNPKSSFILERTLSPYGFTEHAIDTTGITTFYGPIRQQKQIGRNGVIVGRADSVSAVWRDGYNSPPTLGEAGETYLMVTTSGLYAFGYVGGLVVRHDLQASTSESIAGTDYEPLAIDWCGERVVTYSATDSNGRAALFHRVSGSWEEDVHCLVARNATGDPTEEYPNVNDMSANGSIIIGDSSNANNRAFYWDMDLAPDGPDYREAIALPNPADSGSYGAGAYAESVSADGRVIFGSTEYGFSCFWVGPSFDHCFITTHWLSSISSLSGMETIYEDGSGPPDAGVYSIIPWSTYKAQVSINGYQALVMAEKNDEIAPGYKPRSLLYITPAIPFADATPP